MVWNEKAREPTTLQWETSVEYVDIETGELLNKIVINGYNIVSSDRFVNHEKKRINITKYCKRDRQTRIEFGDY